MEPKTNISSLLAPGDISAIAKELGLSPSAASAAIKRGAPWHPAVRLALQLAKKSGAFEAAQTTAALDAQQVAKLTPVSQAA